MPELTEVDLKQQIKTQNFSNLYLLYGAEGYLKQFYANALVKATVDPAMSVFNFKKFDYEDGAELPDILEAAETLPAFGGYMCVLVHDYPLDTMNAADKKLFDEFLKDVPESTVLIFWQDSAEIIPKKNAKWKSVIGKIQKVGAVVALEPRSQSDVLRLLQNGAKKRGCVLERREALLLLEMVGNDLSTLLNEIEKLCNYKQGGEITREDIETMVTKSLEANVFDLSRALNNGDCAKALHILEKLFADKEKPELILGTLISSYVDMYRVKLSIAAGEQATYTAQYFNYKGKDFRLRNAARDIRNMSIPALRGCLDALNKADTALKSGIEDPKIVLEQLIVRLSAAKGMR